MTKLDKAAVRNLARQCGWREVQYNPSSRVIGFKRGRERVNVYYSTGTVGTCTNHPRQGKTQLFRRNVSMSVLQNIFQSVRAHTGKGYYRRLTSQDGPEPSLGNRRWWGSMPDLDDLYKFDSNTTTFLALGESSYFLVDLNGDPFWGSGLPKFLHNKLWGRQRELPSVDFVALGEDDSYFVQFADGKQQWCGLPDSLDCRLEGDGSGPVRTLALGLDEGWFCKWEDGSYGWEGIPVGLHNKVNGRQKSLPGVDEVTLGPNGEWFVRFEDGNWSCNGHADECSSAIGEIHRGGGSIVHIAFGGTEYDPNWLITYDE